MNKKIAIIFLLVALLSIGLVALNLYQQRIPMDPSDVGNLAGNLQNGGLFFEMDGKVYFSNSAEDNCLYSMNLDESKPKRLTTMGVKYISGANNHLYFYMDSTHKSGKVTGLGAASNQFGIYRCNTKGRDQTCLVRDFCGEMQLCGEYIYYQIKTDGTLNKMRVDKKDKQKVADELISPLCYDNGIIYYTGVSEDHALHALGVNGKSANAVVQPGHCFFPVVMDGYLYYLNGDSNYSLWRTSLYSGVQELVVSDRIDCFTMDHEHIYYSFSSSDNPSLRRCDLDGSNIYVLYDGIVNSINLTSRYVYFKVFGDEKTTYHMPLDGSRAPSVFVVGG